MRGLFWFGCGFNRRLLVIAFLQLGLLLPGLAFRGADDPEQRKVFAASRASAQPSSLSAEQVGLMQNATGEGIGVQMRAGWQTRISIRGKNLGEQRSFSRGRGLPVKGKGGYEEDAVAVLDNLSGVMAVRYAAHEFKAQKATGDHLGFHHVRIMQLHQGLKVVGGDLIVHFNAADDPYQVNGSYVPGIEVDLVPQIDAAAAEQIAIKNLSTLDEELDRVAGAPELVVFARDRAPVLAYELALTSTPSGNQAPGLWRYWIDAVTGEVVSRYNDIKDIAAPTGNGANAAISGNILLGEGGGVKTVTGWYENTDNYYLYNKINHWYIYNVSADDVLYPDAETYAYRPSNDWKNTDRTEMSGAVCLDATQLYFKNVHGRSSYNNANAYARANVHEGIYYVNAFWDPARQQFFFGDGDGGTADSLVVMDVVAHEFTHAVTENTADLVYAYEPGALNESFSDIFGACVEFATQPDGRGAYSTYPYFQKGTADWLMGEDCWLSSPALRDMRNPGNVFTVGMDGVQPSRYFGENWYAGDGDSGGVHINSGVQNFFFYLLCEGGTGNNDGVDYSITGIGITDAEKVAYRALTVYCTSATDFRAVRQVWLSAAADLNTNWVPVVDAAWLACGVGPLEIQPNASVEFEGKQGGAFRPWQQTYTLQNHAAMPVSWVASAKQSWLKISPADGSLAAGATTPVFVELTEQAEALAKDIYFDTLDFRTADGVLLGTRQVMLRVGQPDYYTEQFSSWDFDLNGMSLTFTPDGSDSSYSANALPISALHVDPASHNSVYMNDDSSVYTELTDGKTVKLYAGSYSHFYIGSNGYITFNTSDRTYIESFDEHFSKPRISAFFDDLNPAAGGSVKWKQLADCVVVTYIGVPEFGATSSNTFQIEMFFDGRIRLSWLGMAARDGLVGLSRGTGLPPYYKESDLRAFGWDYDGDGIPNTWEMQYFGGNTSCNAEIDSDNDGFSNREEYIAGMHPLNSSSYFHVVDHTVQLDGGTNYVLRWDAVEGREYSIWTTYNLVYLDFDLLKTGIGYPRNSYTTAVEQVQNAHFYKVGVQLIE